MAKNLLSTALVAMTAAYSVAAAEAAQPSPSVQKIISRGKLLCPGHNGSYRGFAELDDKGVWHGLDVDMCKAAATMITGSPDKLEIVPLSWAQRWPALQSGDIDLVIKVTDWTMSRDTELNLQFSNPYFLGGYQFLVPKSLNATSTKQLDGATVCLEAGTVQVRSTGNYLNAEHVKYNLVQYEKQEEAQAAYNAGRCDAFVGWGPNLAVFRVNAKGGADQNVILPEMIDLGPQSVAMKEGDDRFVDTMNWLVSALLAAEQEGVTSQNVDQMKANPPSPLVAKLLGADPGIGDRLGLSNDWAYKVIKAVGNYGEIYDRNLGKDSAYKLDRGLNNLWNKGGLLYPMLID